MQRYKRAVRDFNEALKRKPDDPKFARTLRPPSKTKLECTAAETVRGMHQADCDTLRSFSRIACSPPTPLGPLSIHYRRGLSFFYGRRHRHAFMDFAAAERQIGDAARGDLLYHMGLALACMGRYIEAARKFTLAIEARSAHGSGFMGCAAVRLVKRGGGGIPCETQTRRRIKELPRSCACPSLCRDRSA